MFKVFKSVQDVQDIQSVQDVISMYQSTKMKIFKDWFNVGIKYVDIKYVLHHVLQYFNVYSMYIQCLAQLPCVYNVYSLSI